MPVFVKMERYHEISSSIDKVKAKLSDAKQLLDKVQSLKEEEDRELESWKKQLAEAEEKLSLIEETMPRA